MRKICTENRAQICIYYILILYIYEYRIIYNKTRPASDVRSQKQAARRPAVEMLQAQQPERVYYKLLKCACQFFYVEKGNQKSA